METVRTFVSVLRRRSHPAAPASDRGRGQRGQVLPIFVFMSVVALGGAALLADVAWWWTMEQKAQRAADAGALAGAVYLPSEQGVAFAAAIAEAGKNGFVNGEDGVVVMPRRDATNPRKLIVDIDTPVETFFAKVFSITSVDVGVTGAGEYTLPVPMGSPENYYGVFGILRGATFTEEREIQIEDEDDIERPPSDYVSGGDWNTPSGAWSGPDTTASSNGDETIWRDFGFLTGFGSIPNDPTVAITGLEVLLNNVELNGSGSSGSCRVTANITRDLSAPGGPTWSSPQQTGTLSTSDRDFTLGDDDSMAPWGGGAWSRADLSDDDFGVRLTWNDGFSGCSSSRSVAVDDIDVRVTYTWSRTVTDEVTTRTDDPLRGPGTACANGADHCFNPDGDELNPRGFWATMNTRGASNVNGDAHQPIYIRTPPESGSTVLSPLCNTEEADGNACYDPSVYYNYAVEMAPGSTNGFVYVFDPGFCATDNNRGVGDRWFRSSEAVSSWYELYEDTHNTPYDLSDDTKIASSGSRFTDMDADDSTMGGSGGAECMKNDTGYGDGRDYHLSWFLLNPDRPLSGGTAGRIYRLHTTGTDPAGNLLSEADAEQSFALFAESTGTAPRIYGMAAMQMFTPLSSNGGSTSSEFYLAQIDEAHAGKTVELKLWDPGDTDPLRAHLEILVPRNGGGWAASSRLSYSAKTGTTHGQENDDCNDNDGENVSSILTNRGRGTMGEFNGCWLTIYIPIPADYEAAEDGWWKIRYNMSGDGTSNDVTTWKVAVIGNPVHLIPE